MNHSSLPCNEGQITEPTKDVFWPLLLVLGAAWLVRGSIYFFSPQMPRINGVYYFVQARALLEHGALGVPDLPLLFYFHAALAKIFMLSGADEMRCIEAAVKFSDTFLPPLGAIPIWLLAKEWADTKSKSALPLLAVLLYVTLSNAPMMMFSDFQKNALGLAEMLAFVVAARCAILSPTLARIAWAALWLALTALTHIGVLGTTIVFSLLAAIAMLAMIPEQRKRLAVLFGGSAFVLLAVLLALHLGLEPARAEKLFSMVTKPLKLFNPPLILMLFGGRGGGPIGQSIAGSIFIHGIVIAAALTLKRRWQATRPVDRALVLASLGCALFLGSPFINPDYANRLTLMALVPCSIFLTFALCQAPDETTQKRGAFAVLALTGIGALMALPMALQSSIPPHSRAEIEALRPLITEPDKTVIVARHGVEWWAAWILRTKIAQAPALTNATWQRYDHVLFLQQIGGPRGFGPGMPPGGGPFGSPPPPFGRPPRGMPPGPPNGGPPPFGRPPSGGPPMGGNMQEVQLPDTAKVLRRGQYFQLAEVDEPFEIPTRRAP